MHNMVAIIIWMAAAFQVTFGMPETQVPAGIPVKGADGHLPPFARICRPRGLPPPLWTARRAMRINLARTPRHWSRNATGEYLQ